MKIFLTGGTGFIGSTLIKRLVEKGHEVSVLTRDTEKAKKKFGATVNAIEANPLSPGSWQDEAQASEAIINLCGEPILDKKWTSARKKIILDSRILPTAHIVNAIARPGAKTKILISGSAIGYYSSRGDETLTEESLPGNDFGATLCKQWEAEALKAEKYGIRVVLLRTGMVLGSRGGALGKMVPPFKFFLGGPIASGRQYVSWIHIDDHVGIQLHALANEALRGPVNLTAPNPVTNREFSSALGKVLQRPSWLPVPAFTLRLMFGEGAELLTGGQKVIPQKALETGYTFKFKDVESALRSCLKNE